MAGVALGGIHLHFAVGLGDIYLESTFTLRGRRGTFLKLCWHVYVLEAMLACFRMFRFGPTWEEAVCMFDKNVLEAMLACFSRSCIHCIHVLYYPGQVLFSSFMVVGPVAVGQAWLSSEFVVVSVSFSMLLI